MDEFNLPEGTRQEVNELLTECEQMLTGVKMIQELSPKSLDQLVSYAGERCSVRILAARLNQIGVPAQAFDASEVGILTDSDFGDARLLKDHEGAVQKAFERIDPNVVAVVTGFIGHDPAGKITTLGRGTFIGIASLRSSYFIPFPSFFLLYYIILYHIPLWSFWRRLRLVLTRSRGSLRKGKDTQNLAAKPSHGRSGEPAADTS
jgi:hypothetical protein